MEKPRLKPAKPDKPAGFSRLGLVLVNLPWLFVLLVLYWIWR
jgi:hypothetical protein